MALTPRMYRLYLGFARCRSRRCELLVCRQFAEATAIKNVSYDVVVVGAGITGTSAAYHLKKKGAAKVLLLETGAGPACSNTGRSAAIVRTYYTTPLMTRLAKAAVELFEGMTEELGRDGGFRQTGFTQIVPPDWVDDARRMVAMHQAAGIDTRIIPPSDYGRVFPWLNPEGVGLMVLEVKSGYSDPVQVSEAFADAFVDLGGEARYHTPCRALVRDGDRVAGVVLDEGFVAAGSVVNAAGPWSPFLARSVGLDLPMRALREQDIIIEVPVDRTMPSTPVSNPIEPTYMRPVAGEGRWLLGRGFPKPYVEVDPYNYKKTFDDDFAVEVLELMTKRIPSLEGSRIVGGYAALYDTTPDWMPFFGPRRELTGYYDACGGSGHAYKTGPIMARELADWLLDDVVKDDFRQLGFDRVADGRMFVSTFGGNRG